MKKILVSLLILSLLAALPFSLLACKKSNVKSEKYDPEKYTESIDLTKYQLVFEDDFEGELNRNVWGDTRQGTRRDGFWTKNLAYTDGNGHLIIRTEKRGSRYCSETVQRSVRGYNGSVVTVTYDDCSPFGMLAGDFGDIDDLHAHTDDLVGNVILSKFDDLGSSFSKFISGFEIPSGSTAYAPAMGEAEIASYSPFYQTAMELFSYYSFVPAVKTVDSSLEQSALIGVNRFYTMTFDKSTVSEINAQLAVAHLFGFESEAEFSLFAQHLANTYSDYRAELKNGAPKREALENGCFLSSNGCFIFPVAIRNECALIVTYVILDNDGQVSVWVNDLAALLRATNYDYDHYSGATVNNETFCKNVLFVTGPEGVYSGALRTRDLYTHGFGYYEIRCKLPDTEGIWHAFWMMCGNVYSVENGSEDGIEIDVFEYLPARDAINCALHWDGYDDDHKNAHLRFEDVGCADGEFHTFGMNWDEDGYTFYIDGKKVWTSTGGGICKQPGYMKISTEYGEWGDWVGSLAEDFQPVDWVIDYVKVYDKK